LCCLYPNVTIDNQRRNGEGLIGWPRGCKDVPRAKRPVIIGVRPIGRIEERWATREKKESRRRRRRKKGQTNNENETVGVDLGHKPENRQTGNN
jgi:hypothetical protein